jgi:hypothetical protein
VRNQRKLQVQGAYYVATGLWPLLSMRSFERVTGPKTDKWLVQMVGLLAACIGVSLCVSARREEVDESTFTLAIASAFSFAAIDVMHAAQRRISPIYLADALVEAGIIVSLLSAG